MDFIFDLIRSTNLGESIISKNLVVSANRVIKGLCVTRDLSKNSPVTREIRQNLFVTRELLV